jgi:hypothetical protein
MRDTGGEVVNAVVRSTSYLPEPLSTRLLMMLKATTYFGGDTHRNVEMFTNKIVLELDEERA